MKGLEFLRRRSGISSPAVNEESGPTFSLGVVKVGGEVTRVNKLRISVSNAFDPLSGELPSNTEGEISKSSGDIMLTLNPPSSYRQEPMEDFQVIGKRKN